MNVTALEKVWMARDGDLVCDGDARAAILYARKGEAKRAVDVERHAGASRFFGGLAVAVVEPVKRGPGRPKKE